MPGLVSPSVSGYEAEESPDVIGCTKNLSTTMDVAEEAADGKADGEDGEADAHRRTNHSNDNNNITAPHNINNNNLTQPQSQQQKLQEPLQTTTITARTTTTTTTIAGSSPGIGYHICLGGITRGAEESCAGGGGGVWRSGYLVGRVWL